MVSYTPILSLPIIEGSDKMNFPADISALANAVEAGFADNFITDVTIALNNGVDPTGDITDGILNITIPTSGLLHDPAKLDLAGGTMTGAINMSGNKVTGLGLATSDTDATSRIYVEDRVLRARPFRNLIDNGAMKVAQRTDAKAVAANTYSWSLDRWQISLVGSASGQWEQLKLSSGQSVPVSAGLTNALRFLTVNPDVSLAPGEYGFISHKIDGHNASQLSWGTASAKDLKVSFWVKTSVPGKYSFVARSNGATQSYPTSFTTTTADWEFKTITIPGPTTGTWGYGEGGSIGLFWGLGSGTTFAGPEGAWANANYISSVGSVSMIGVEGATFDLTGVQAEASYFTPFEHRHYYDELQHCMKYYRYYNFLYGVHDHTVPGQAFQVHDITSMYGTPSSTALSLDYAFSGALIAIAPSVNTSDGMLYTLGNPGIIMGSSVRLTDVEIRSMI